jgi:hypothetical protein
MVLRFIHVDNDFAQFAHDCRRCIYIGSVSTGSRKSYGDLYVCPQSTVIIRDGNEGWEYESGIHLMLEPVIAAAVSRAMLSGLVPATLYQRLLRVAGEHTRLAHSGN